MVRRDSQKAEPFLLLIRLTRSRKYGAGQQARADIQGIVFAGKVQSQIDRAEEGLTHRELVDSIEG
ncbi:MAG: hypothetical protein WBE26_11985 [Phycisphaerae bacterium]